MYLAKLLFGWNQEEFPSWTKLDTERGLELVHRAAALKDPDAFHVLGDVFHAGQLVEQDDTKAALYFKKLGKAGRLEGWINAGTLYMNGSSTVDKKPERGFRYFEKAAKLGSKQAYQQLAWCYYEGQGVEQSKETAMKLLKALESGAFE